MKRLWPFIFLGFGLCVVLGSFAYEGQASRVLSVPYTPEMYADYLHSVGLAETLRCFGESAFLFGLFAGVIPLLVRRFSQP